MTVIARDLILNKTVALMRIAMPNSTVRELIHGHTLTVAGSSKRLINTVMRITNVKTEISVGTQVLKKFKRKSICPSMKILV